MQNAPHLITYPDRLAGDLDGLARLMDGTLNDAFAGVHVLPFYVRIDGADAGFDPTDHTRVDPSVGDWGSVAEIGARQGLMADLIVNHISAESSQFLDWLDSGKDSQYDGMFLEYDSVFPGGATQEDLHRIYRPRPGLPFTALSDSAGREHRMWTTFTSNQIDIDVEHVAGWSYLESILDRFQAAAVSIVRLDAVGYAIKRPGTPSFMIPETFQFIERLSNECHRRGMEVLVEMHGHYQTQIEVADKVDYVYDFALPPWCSTRCIEIRLAPSKTGSRSGRTTW